MLKFSKLNESKRFFPDPSIVKRYASYIIPLYLQGELKCEEKLIDEWLDMQKSKEKHKYENVICDLEIMAIKNIFDNPTTTTGYNQLKLDIDNKCLKLEKFLRKYYLLKKDFK